MIALIGASAIYLIASQAAISAPRSAFMDCLKQASQKATSQKVAGDAYEGFLRTTCSSQLDGLRSALIGFSVKNGMARKAAIDDADMTISDYVDSSTEHYKFMASVNSPPQKPAQPAQQAQSVTQVTPATPPATPASAPTAPK